MRGDAITADSMDSNPEEWAEELNDLRLENRQLKERVAWFEKQLFGSKSEKRHVVPPEQESLLGSPTTTPAEASDQQTITYQRGKAKKQRPQDCATDAGLRFTDEVPIEVIKVTPPELEGAEAYQYEVIDTQVRHKLAQRPASYVVLQYEIPILKRRVPKDEPSTQAASTSHTGTVLLPHEGNPGKIYFLFDIRQKQHFYHVHAEQRGEAYWGRQSFQSLA